MTFNFLTWDSPNLPFPEEVKPLLAGTDLSEVLWNVTGLPVHGAKYSILFNQLYLEEDPTGQASVHKEDFTGEFIIGGLFVNQNVEEPSYMVTFLVKALNGEVVGIELHGNKNYDTKEYNQYINDFSDKVKKKIYRQQKWWYKWLYTPYMFVVRGIALLVCYLLILLKVIVEKIALFLTPY